MLVESWTRKGKCTKTEHLFGMYKVYVHVIIIELSTREGRTRTKSKLANFFFPGFVLASRCLGAQHPRQLTLMSCLITCSPL